MKVCINAGHCPYLDPGAVGQTGLQEADVCNELMQKVSGHLTAIGYEVYLVQENSLATITTASNEFGADLFLSIHCNGVENINVRGTETFCYIFGGNGEILARCIQQQIVDSLGTIDRGVKTTNFYVLKYTDCPAVLVETAFISNSEDEQLLIARLDDFVAAIARGVTDYENSIC